jgi:hypothetical protein
MKSFVSLVIGLTIVIGSAHAAHAAAAGIAEVGLGLDVPVAEGEYRRDFQTSPSLWLAGVFLPRDAQRTLGAELAIEYTPYQDDFAAKNGAETDFSRVRFTVGARYFHRIAPELLGFARALAGLDMIVWEQQGQLGNSVAYTDDDAHLGLALELGAGALYRLGPLTLGAQLALPVGIHRQTVHDMRVAVDRDAFDLELRFTVGTNY